MKIRDLLIERKQEVHRDQQDAIPSMSSVGVPPLPMGPTNFYHKYRLGVMMAGSPDDEHDYPETGQFVDDMVMVGYSEADREIIAKSITKFGYDLKKLTPDGSTESAGTYTVSPVSNWNK